MKKDYLVAIQQELQELGLAFELIQQEDNPYLSCSIEKADCFIELFSNGRWSLQFGVDMEELRTLLAGSSTEDIAEDELQRVARDHLRPTVSKYRSGLIALGFNEGIETTEEYYAMSFIKSLDLSHPSDVCIQLRDCLKIFT